MTSKALLAYQKINSLKKKLIKFCQENANILKSGSGRMSTAEDKKNDRKAPPLWEALGKD